MPDLVPVVFLMFSRFSLFRQKKGFLLRHRSPSSKDSASEPDPQYLRRTHGMHRRRIQTSHKGCHPPPRSVPVVPENDKFWQNSRLHTNAYRIVHKTPAWMAGFQKNERSKAYHYKSNSLNLLRYGGIIQWNCHFKIHAQFLVHGIDQFSSSSTPYRAITLSLYFSKQPTYRHPHKRS